jgi:hypothetical protein
MVHALPPFQMAFCSRTGWIDRPPSAVSTQPTHTDVGIGSTQMQHVYLRQVFRVQLCLKSTLAHLCHVQTPCIISITDHASLDGLLAKQCEVFVFRRHRRHRLSRRGGTSTADFTVGAGRFSASKSNESSMRMDSLSTVAIVECVSSRPSTSSPSVKKKTNRHLWRSSFWRGTK